MNRQRVVEKLLDNGLIAVVRGSSMGDAIDSIRAITEGGISAIEVTMTIPNPIETLREVVKAFIHDESIIIGAGTVLDDQTARECILAGARFVVSPIFSREIINCCNRYQIPVMSGAMTLTEVVLGLEAGADIIKIFPGNLFGPSIIKAFKGPVPQGKYMPTGGVSLENMHDWFQSGAVAVGVGSDLTKEKTSGGYEAVVNRSKQYVKRLEEIRGNI